MTRTRKLTFPVLGLGCGGAGADTIEKVVARVPGVTAVYVNRADETAYIDFDPDACGPNDLRVAIESAGYRVVPPPPTPAGEGAA